MYDQDYICDPQMKLSYETGVHMLGILPIILALWLMLFHIYYSDCIGMIGTSLQLDACILVTIHIHKIQAKVT